MILIRTKQSTTHQSDHLAGLANDLEVLEALEYEGDIKWADGDHVDYVHCLFQEPGPCKLISIFITHFHDYQNSRNLDTSRKVFFTRSQSDEKASFVLF